MWLWGLRVFGCSTVEQESPVVSLTQSLLGGRRTAWRQACERPLIVGDSTPLCAVLPHPWSRVSEAFTSRRIPRVAALRGSLEYLLCGALWEQLSTEPPNTLAQWGPLEQLFYGLSQNSCSTGSLVHLFPGVPWNSCSRGSHLSTASQGIQHKTRWVCS